MLSDDQSFAIIKNEISPLLQRGDLTLFLGAGISIDTPTINGLGVPSTPSLIERICKEAGFDDDDSNSTNLTTAFGVGEDEIDNFENFLISNFSVTKPHSWQKSIFRHWWRCIFTTNIDTIPEVCIQMVSEEHKDYPNYRIYNYLDREPLETLPTSPPVVYLHGNVSKFNEGFVFDNVSYARNTVKNSDWLSKCALHISHGNCLFVGSRFDESDIEAAIRQREAWDIFNNGLRNNWIVLRKFSQIERRGYEKRGIIPIEATADEFFTTLFSFVSYLSPAKFIRRKAPYLSEDTNAIPAAWFSQNMENISLEISKAKNKRGVFSRFYFGDLPDWFYIAHNVPATFDIVHKLTREILLFESDSNNKSLVVSIIGPLCSGKTTAAMLICARLAETHTNIYNFCGLDGIDIEKIWNVLKDLKGLVVLLLDASSEYYYAVNELISRVNSRPTACKLCFVLEERTIHFERNQKHLFKIPEDRHKIFKVSALSHSDAEILYEKTIELGITFEKMKNKEKSECIEQIVSFENGYKGDLLATLYELSSRKSYHNQLKEEYSEIYSDEAKNVYQTIALVTASRISIPLNYLAETHGYTINVLAKIIQNELKDKTHSSGSSLTISARHHSIAEFHINNNFEKEPLKNRIIELMLIKLMHCVGSKFSPEDIKQHPISYKIYNRILSYHYLTEVLFKEKNQYHFIHEIYSVCQNLFSSDGMFWLQYGRFLERDGDINGAIHCLYKGLNLFDSFQTRHALGQMLLKRYRTCGFDENDYQEGLTFLMNEVNLRGEVDPYALTALGNELVKIIQANGVNINKQEDCLLKLKDIVNKGINIHKSDKFFMQMVGRYFELNQKIEIV